MRIVKIIKKQEQRLFLLFLIATALVYSFLGIRNHEQFQTFAWDLGFFDQLIWKASKFRYPYSTIGDLTILGDHFQLVLYLLVPLYWLWSNVRIILTAQAFLIVFAAFPLYLLATQILKSKLSAWAVVFSFLFFTGTQFTVTNEFHQSAFIPLFLNSLFLFYQQKRWRPYWLMIIGLLCTREEMALLIVAIGVFLILKKQARRRGLFTILFGMVAFVLLVYLVIPFFNPHKIYPHFGYGMLGETPQTVVLTIICRPGLLLTSLVSPPVKLKTVFTSFLSFGFLPLFSPAFLIPIGQQFATRFIDSVSVHRWLNLNHYAIPLASLLSVASVYGILNLSQAIEKLCSIKETKVIKILGVYLFLFTILQDLLFHGPINSLSKPQLYKTQPWMQANYQVLQKIPKEVSLAAQNSLVPHISQRDKIYLLPEINNAEYIWVDLEDGPNKYAPLTYQETETLISNLLKEEEYIIYYQQGKSLLLKKQ